MKNSIKETAKNVQKNVEAKVSGPRLYSIDPEQWNAMSDKEKKSYRRKRRSILNKHIANITGKDRSPKEIKDAIASLKKDFKEFYIGKTLETSNLYDGSNANKIAEIDAMLAKVK